MTRFILLSRLLMTSALSATVLVASAPGCSSSDALDSTRSAAVGSSSGSGGASANSSGSGGASSGAGGSGGGSSSTTTGAGGTDTTVTSCPTASMDTSYPGPWPPNPYGVNPPATECVAAEHDVIIVLGCPNNADGTPSSCQTKRADMAVSLMSAGFGQRFITSGGAVHNAYVEADTLKALLLARGVPDGSVFTETKAQHTDENLYYSTQIMLTHGWTNALMVSDDPGHLMMTALCDTNCCVDLGRLTLFSFPVAQGATLFAGHYALYPWGHEVSKAECDTIEILTKFMCMNLASRKACAGNLQLPP